MQNVIRPVKGARTFNGHDVGWTLDDTDHGLIAPGVGTDWTQSTGFGDVAASLAERELDLHLTKRQRETIDVFAGLAHEPKSNTLRRLRANAGKSSQFIDHGLQGWWVGHEISSAPGNISVMR